MYIVMITGSPHKNGTSALLADEFIKGAEESGHSVFRFNTAFECIHPCIGCDSCQCGDKPCVFQDDMNLLYPELKKAEIPIYPMPTIQKVAEKLAAQDASKGFSWFLNNHVGDWDKGENEEALHTGNRLYINYVSPSPLEENQRIHLIFSITGELSGKTMWYVLQVNTGDLQENTLRTGSKFCFVDTKEKAASCAENEANGSWTSFAAENRVNRFEIGKTKDKKFEIAFLSG